MRQRPPKDGRTHRVLVINPGSTSTKVALYRGTRCAAQETTRHSAKTLRSFHTLIDQVPMRQAAVLRTLRRDRIDPAQLDALAARGGLLAPCPAGTYRVGPAMLAELEHASHGAHASNLGAIIAARIADAAHAPAYIVDPVVVDELCPAARFSGIPEISRRSVWHALNQRAAARRVAKTLGRRYQDLNLVVAHLGGGTSVAAHRRGKAIDVNNALDGDGPFAVERSGGLPAGDLVRLAHNTPLPDMLRTITGRGGAVAYLGTNDMLKVERAARAGDARAAGVLAAMAYQIAKEIGSCAAALAGRVDAVVLTGALARCGPLVRRVRHHVAFIAPVRIVPGEMEMQALALGALRVLRGEERARRYKGITT